jgi:hypothetical protein
MADQPEKPGKRWVIVKFFEHAVERTEEQISELKGGRLFVRDATGPDDTQSAGSPAPPAADTAARPQPPQQAPAAKTAQ